MAIFDIATSNDYAIQTYRRPNRNWNVMAWAGSGVFTSVADLHDAIRRYIREHNQNPKPFVWTKTADVILIKTSRLPVASV